MRHHVDFMKTVVSGKEKARLLALFIAIAVATLAAVGASVLIGRSYVFLAGLGILVDSPLIKFKY